MTLTLVQRYSRMVGRGMDQWDTDSGKSHVAENGRTLCGRLVGSISRGWEQMSSWYNLRPDEVTCKHCQRAVAKAEGPDR